MRKALGTALLALLTAMTGVLVAPVGTARADGADGADGVVRLMLAGDSITQGFDGDFTWRYRLAEELARQGVPFDFVGPRRAPHGGRDAYLAKGWDTDHDAKGGTTLNAQLGNITSDMQAYEPDVLVALYGTNDLLNGATPDVLMARWRLYVERARAVRPDVTLVLGEVYSGKAARRDEANAMLDALAEELDTEESPVFVADLESPQLVLSVDTYDRTHPTPTGETLIAQRVCEALYADGIVPETPEIARSFVQWTPPVRAVVHRHGHRLSIDWRASKQWYRARHMRVRWTNVRTGRSVTSVWNRRVKHLTTKPLKPGRYLVTLQASRRSMTSAWGPAVVRRIPR